LTTLKVEKVYLAGDEKVDDFAARPASFIEEIDKERRVHSALGDPSPNHFEAQLVHKRLGFLDQS